MTAFYRGYDDEREPARPDDADRRLEALLPHLFAVPDDPQTRADRHERIFRNVIAAVRAGDTEAPTGRYVRHATPAGELRERERRLAQREAWLWPLAVAVAFAALATVGGVAWIVHAATGGKP